MSDLISMLEPLLRSGEFWVLVSFAGLVGLAFYYRAPRQIIKSLDARAEEISRDLKEAGRLYDEAQSVLQKHEGQLAQLQDQADDIMRASQKASKDYDQERSTALSAYLRRQEKQAEARIVAARQAAIDSLHQETSRLAIAAAAFLIRKKADPAALINRGIDEIESALKKEKQQKIN